MSSDRTGHALGTLDPVIYFEMGRDTSTFENMMAGGPPPKGWKIMPPQEIGTGTTIPKMLFEKRCKAQGYEWKEANTIYGVDALQKALIEQELRIGAFKGERMDIIRERARAAITSTLRQRMISSSCSPYERDFISNWLALRDDEKRKKYAAVWDHKQQIQYIWAREQDSKKRVEDRMGDG